MGGARHDAETGYVIPLSLDGTELLSVDTSEVAQGWAAYFSAAVAEAGTEVLIRLGGRQVRTGPATVWSVLEVRELRMRASTGAAGFASSLLREIPILKIEAAINQTAHRERLGPSVLRTLDETGITLGGSGFRTPPTTRSRPKRLPLTIKDPGGYRKPDSFYRTVADLYLHQAAVSPRPAHDIAEANGMPLATVHRWIREAKARGILLLPAHRGRRSSPHM